MSEQGERGEPRAGEDRDWWSQLYDPRAPDTGGSSAGDTIDDRFASARAVGASAKPDTAGARTGDGDAEDEPGIVEAPPPVSAQQRDEPPGRDVAEPEGAAWLDRLFGPSDPAEEAVADGKDRDGPGAASFRGEGAQGAPRPPGDDARGSAVPGPSRPVVDREEPDDATLFDGGRPGPGVPAHAETPVGGRQNSRAGGVRWRSMREAFGHSRRYGDRYGGAPAAGAAARGRLEPPEPGTLAEAGPEALSDVAPDTVLDGARHGGLVLRAVSGRGGSARQRGEPRGDTLFTARFGTGDTALLFVAVAVGAVGARGAGAGPAGRRAAREVCRSIGEAVGRSRPRLVEDIAYDRRAALAGGLKRLTDRCYGRLRSQAAALGLGPEEYHADLRCLLVPTDSACRERIVFGAGTGGLFRLRDGDWEDLEPAAEAAERPRGVPAHLPDPRAPERAEGREAASGPPAFRFGAVTAEPGDTLLLCTSGLAVPLRGDPTFADQLAANWSATGAGPPDLATFLTDVQYPAPAYGDDRTAVALWQTAR